MLQRSLLISGKSGVCGYGPTYCGKGCISNCTAKAECGKFAKKGDEKCPLNVCCSEFGFCGTTKDFCTGKCQSNCGTPKVPAGKSTRPVREKVIAYYEAWSARRKCHSFQPSQIPISSVTHINFAFAYIDPETFRITTMDSRTPESLFETITSIKSMKSGLGDPVEVWIAIGGWTFSNNHTETQPVFSEISKSEENRQKFANNAVAFMMTYGFDGIDIDWEYPGATDRGGKKEQDTRNFIKLIKTLRKTFDESPRGGYGLSFTIPSSYWYLRWFDVPAMLKAGASWVNLMSYDLHGVWDQNSAIGSKVQAHTNLTEIKQSVELLWRNNVPPGKVILGTGFYGRSFQLSNPSCNKPGCKFKGAADKGPCTNEGGILGYFEIQDILKKHKVSKIHDKEAAVNYFSYNRDQWVSYDDKVTFQQKVKWADSVGLGGLMIWAIDLDDNDFTALSGLIGKSVKNGINKLPSISDRDGKSWSSESGQDCYVTSCGARCPLTEVTLKSYDSTCGKGEQKHVCCPRDRAPKECTWRGGESGDACHGQCHEGELVLTFDRNGDKWCTSGQQVLCCTSDRYKALLEGCELGDCKGDCPSGTHEVAKQTCGRAFSTSKAPWCCKQKLEDCHWVGKGGCDQNNCANHDVQLARSERGDGKWGCNLGGRKKSLCCNAPSGVEPYTPVPLESLFPEVPPVDSTIKYDLQILGGFTGSGAETTHDNTHNDPSFAPFGFVLIAGPKNAVSSISKRDNSHVEVVDCSRISTSGSQSVRIFCSNDGNESNCEDMLEGGLEGTVLRMPDNCGPAAYVVAQSLTVSEDQSLPYHLAKRKPVQKQVLDLEFHYDFKRVKRSDEKIYVRVDWSNMGGYWDEIVAASPDGNSKRSLHPRYLGQRDLDKRFFSDDSAEWSRKFEKIRDTRFWTDFSSPATSVLVNSEVKCDDGGYLKIEAKTKSEVYAKFGFTMIGTLNPFSFDSVYGFLDTWYDVDVEVSVSGFSGLDTDEQPKTGPDTEKQDMAFIHPGLVNLVPNFDIFFSLKADDAEFTADFKTEFSVKSDPDINRGWIRRTFPSTAGKSSGAALLDGTHFQGELMTTKGSAEISVRPQFNIGLKVDGIGVNEFKRDDGSLEPRQGIDGAKYDISLYSAVALVLNGKGLYQENRGLNYGLYATAGDAFENWDSEPTNGELMGKASKPVLVHKADESAEAPNAGDSSERGLFGLKSLTCPKEDKKCPDLKCDIDLCATGDYHCREKSTNHRPPRPKSRGKDKRSIDSSVPHSRHSHHPHGLLTAHAGHEKLHKRFKAHVLQEIEVTSDASPNLFSRDSQRYTHCLKRETGNQKTFIYRSLPAPSISEFAYEDERWEKAYNTKPHNSCTQGSVSEVEIAETAVKYVDPDYCAEHIVELQTMGIFLEDMSLNILADGSPSGLPQIYCDFIEFLNKDVLDDAPELAGLVKSDSNTPIHRIMWAHGTRENDKRFVFLEAGINVAKESFWKGTLRTVPEADSAHALKKIRQTLNVFSYLSHTTVNQYFAEICNLIRKEFDRAEQVWVADGNKASGIVDYWDAWIRNHQRYMVTKGLKFIDDQADRLERYWHDKLVSNDDCDRKTARDVLADLATLKRQRSLVAVKLDKLD
ncbi:bacteriodes thetaiotaomicron symbiotic chitinase [Fusarium beomiforme]|uniref:chitinase n=1 Tax=Fusarium beomiforme TaxID=44412 RepID=A0A9P5DSC2_9HYPO|nr:bacteriodes thetaiotaomicron symbiotic chitinase [Fusarium beomiforme]